MYPTVPPRAISACEPCAPKLGEITEQLKTLELVVDRLHNAIGELEDRLHPVLTPPNPDAEGKAPTGIRTSPLGSVLGDLVQRFDSATARVHELRSRVAL